MLEALVDGAFELNKDAFLNGRLERVPQGLGHLILVLVKEEDEARAQVVVGLKNDAFFPEGKDVVKVFDGHLIS